MSTFQQIKAEIADETMRSDLLSGGQIASAVKAVIRLRGEERFWFNETRAFSFATTSGDDSYTLAPDEALDLQEFLTIDYMEVLIGSQYRRMCRISPEEMASAKENGTTGQPLDWAQVGDEIQIYPTPNAAYTIRVAGHFKLIELANDGDENAWLTHGYDMIKEDAKAFLNATVIRNTEAAATFREAAEIHHAALQRINSRKTATGRLRPWC